MMEMFLHRCESIASIAMTLMSKNGVGCGCAFGQHSPIVFTRPMECNRRDFASFQHFGICKKWTVIKAQRCCPLMKSFSIIDAYKCAHLQAQKLHDFSESPWANHSMRWIECDVWKFAQVNSNSNATHIAAIFIRFIECNLINSRMEFVPMSMSDVRVSVMDFNARRRLFSNIFFDRRKLLNN